MRVVVAADGAWLATFEYEWHYEYSERLIEIDPVSGSQNVVAGPADLGGVWASADGSAIVLTQDGLFSDDGDLTCARLRGADGTFGECAPIPGFYGDVHLESDADGDRWASAAGLFDASLQPIGGSIDIAYPDPPTLPAPDGSSVYVFASNQLYRVDPATRRIHMRVQVPFGQPLDLLTSPDGRLVMRITEGGVTSVVLP